MKEKNNNPTLTIRQGGIKTSKNLQGYPLYPSSEDIYSKYEKKQDINPEDTSENKESNENDTVWRSNEKDFKNHFSGSDLDIPGSELDDKQELIGNEDEENNFYSLGGDDHNDLDEDR